MSQEHPPEAQVPPELGGAVAHAGQLLEAASPGAAHRALVGLALPGLLPGAVHLRVRPAQQKHSSHSAADCDCTTSRSVFCSMKL